jgi:2-iminobutanoate/2-iminopropanoate deaminase
MTATPSTPAPEPVVTTQAPIPAGHYSQGLVHGNLVFVSGQLPVRPDGAHTASEPFDTQARQAIANLLAVLRAAGSRASDVLKVTVYIVGVEHWPALNRIYAEAFGPTKPARSVVPVPALHHGYLVEIEAVAVRQT